MTNQPYDPTEDELQRYSADLIRAFGVPGVISFHVPNGGKRHISTAKRLKEHGVLAGVPDWLHLLPHGRYACTEIKDHDGKQSSSQKEFQRQVEAIGGVYRVASTTNEIEAVFTELGIIQKPASGTVSHNNRIRPTKNKRRVAA